MLLFLPWIASQTFHLAVGMLVLSCIALWWVDQAHQDAFVMLLLPCSVFCQVWNLLTELAMFTWVPSYLLFLFGSWSVRDFCSMPLVDSCHAWLWQCPEELSSEVLSSQFYRCSFGIPEFADIENLFYAVFGEITSTPPSTRVGVREHCHNSYNECFSKVEVNDFRRLDRKSVV